MKLKNIGIKWSSLLDQVSDYARYLTLYPTIVDSDDMHSMKLAIKALQDAVEATEEELAIEQEVKA